MRTEKIFRGGRINDAGELTYTMSEAGKIVNNFFGKRNTLLGYMRAEGILDSKNHLTVDYQDGRYFKHELSTGYDPYRKRLFSPVRVTKEGIEYLAKLAKDYQPFTLIDDTNGENRVLI